MTNEKSDDWHFPERMFLAPAEYAREIERDFRPLLGLSGIPSQSALAHIEAITPHANPEGIVTNANMLRALRKLDRETPGDEPPSGGGDEPGDPRTWETETFLTGLRPESLRSGAWETVLSDVPDPHRASDGDTTDEQGRDFETFSFGGGESLPPT